MKSTSSPTKGVFFDLYGTLLVYGDMERAWSVWFEALFSEFRQTIPQLAREDLAQSCEGFFHRPAPEGVDESLTVYERRLQRVAGQLDQSLSQKALGEAACSSVEAWQKHITLDQEAPTILSTLSQKKMPLALITNFDHPPHIHRLIDRLDLRQFFDVITISGEVGVKKPDPKIFGAALEATGLKPQDIIYVGDSDEDILAAANCGMRPVLIRRSDSLSEGARTGYDSRPDNDTTGEFHDSDVIVISELRELLRIGQGSD